MAQQSGEHGSTGNSGGKIVLLGATGFTGRLTAEAMVRADLAPVLAGRNPERLQTLAKELTRLAPSVTPPTWQQADANIFESVSALVSDPADVLVSTAGPFSVVGAPAVLAAINAGCTYVDSTGEAGFIRQVFERSDQATTTGARLIPACGYDFIPGNLAGALALRNCHDRGDIPARIDIGYFTRGPVSMSSGTQASAIASLGAAGYQFRGGILKGAALGTEFCEFTLVDGKKVGGISIGGTEQFGLPAMSPSLIDVNVFLGWAGKWSKPISQVARVTQLFNKIPGSSALTQLVTDRAMTTTGAGPTGSNLFGGTSIAIAVVRDLVGRPLETVQVEGPAPYPLTAELLAWAAAMAAGGKVHGSGALDPISAFGLGPFLAGCAAVGLHQVRYT